jgi:uncharacterized protein with HEPN domain
VSRSADERCQDILVAIARCERYRDRFGDSDPEVVEMAFQAAIRYIAVIGEAANHLPEEITSAHPEIPWRAIVEMRNILIHEYFGVDHALIIRTLERDLAPLAVVLRQHLAGRAKPNVDWRP